MDSRLAGLLKCNLFFSGFMTAFSITILLVFNPDLAVPEYTIWQFVFVTCSFLSFLPLIIQSKNIDVMCNFETKKLDPQRVQDDHLFAVFFAVIFWLAASLAGIISLLPLTASFLGVSLAYYFAHLSRKHTITSINF
jgi:hypothetical protein